MKKLIIMTHLFLSILLFSSGSIAVDLVPRIGVNVGSYYLEEYVTGDTADEVVVGPTAGLLFVLTEDSFFDLALELYSFDTEFSGDSTDRSELALTFGMRMHETMYAIFGFQSATYGDGYFDDAFATSSGPYAGVSVNNLRMGQDSTNVFSIALALQAQTTEITGVPESSDLSFNLKLGYRSAGSPHSFSMKYQTFGSEFHAEWIGMFNYSYQIGAI